MDCSEKYILMCEKAKEIQEERKDWSNRQSGDFYFLQFPFVSRLTRHRKYKKYSECKIGDIVDGCKCVDFDELTQLLTFESFTKEKENFITVYSEDIEGYLSENNYCSDYHDGISYEIKLEAIIWLPRQDQLQEMLYFEYRNSMFYSQIQSFYEFLFRKSSIIIHNNSFEKAWLMFVMKEKYNKSWSEEQQNWVTE